MDLIKVKEDRTVCGKELHKFLEVRTRLGDWFSRRADEYGWLQPVDFTLLRNEHGDIKDLRIDIDIAKEICMVERTEKGRQARHYFIEVEKTWRQNTSVALTPAEMLLEQAKHAVEQERKIVALEKRQEILEGRVKLLSSDSEYRTVRGLANQLGVPVSRDAANLIGRKAASICRDKKYVIGKVPDERDGQVNSYPIHVLKGVVEAWKEGIL